MSHSVKVTIIADQKIKLLGTAVDIHDIETLVINPHGEITDFYMNPKKKEGAEQEVVHNIFPRPPNIFKLSTLLDRALKIRSFKDGNCKLIVAQDVNTRELFVISAHVEV